MATTTAAAAEFQDGGKPVAQPYYLVDANGNPISSTGLPLPVNVTAGSISAENPSVSATGAAVPADATYIGGVNGGNLLGIALDSGGRQYVVQTVGGNPLSATNPEPNISNIQQLIMNGQGFSVSTGKQSAGVNAAAQFLVANTGAKNVLIYSILLAYTNAANMHQVQLITATDANITGGTGHATPTAQNNEQGSATTPQAATVFTYCTAIANSGVATGNPLSAPVIALNVTYEVLTNGQFILVPPAAAGGVGIYLQTTAAGQFSITVKWVEF